MKVLQRNYWVLIGVFATLLVVSCGTTPPPVEREGTLSLVERFVFNGHIRGAQGLSFNSTREHLASGGWDNHIFVWDTQRGVQFLSVRDAHESDVISIGYDSRGEVFVSAGLDRTIKVWDAQTGKIVKTFSGFGHNVIGVAVFRDTTRFFVAGAVLTGEIVILDYQTGKRHATFWHSSYATNVAFNASGTALASTGNDRVVRLWSVAEKESIRTFRGHTAKVNTVAFHPNGTMIASGAWDNSVRVWEVATGKTIYNFENAHSDAVEQVQFSPTGAYIVSGARDGIVNIFETSSGKNIVRYDTGNTRVYNVVFNADASKIAVTGYDHTVRVYDITR